MIFPNEPECRNADGTNPCWQGTEEQFTELYAVTAKHLKSRFPNIKIGGPAFTSPWETNFKRKFLKTVKENSIPLDFYSFHCYADTPDGISEAAAEGYDALKAAGLDSTEIILDEWNYIKGWSGDGWKESLDIMEISIKIIPKKLCNRLNSGRFHMPLFEKIIA